MNSIQTTGGLFTSEIKERLIENICKVFECQEQDITDIYPVQAGLTNIVICFRYNGGKYIYRHPGLGSDVLVSRGRETIMQKVVDDIGIDTTLIAIDVDEGWRISRYIENDGFNYKNLNDMVRGIMLLRKLHDAPCRVRWNFNILKKAEEIAKSIPAEKYGNFDEFAEIRERIFELGELVEQDGIKKCNVHGDARDVNFLINQDEIYLIDWEYGGYNDPGFDLGSYICGGDHSIEEIDKILFTYYRKKPTHIQKRHMYAYIAITGYFYMHWTMLKESKGQKVGIIKEQWYRYAKEFSLLALKMYRES